MKFDWSVNFGGIVEVATIVIALFAMHTQNVRRLEKIEQRLEIMFAWFEETVIRGRGARGD